MGYGKDIPIYWPGQTTQDWKRYDRDGYNLWFMKGRALAALDSYDVDPDTLPIYERLNLKPLQIRNSAPLDVTVQNCPQAWAPPAEVAAAADRLAAALEARDPEAAPFVEEYTEGRAEFRRGIEYPIPADDKDWEFLGQEFRDLARVARKVAEEGISQITLDMGGNGWAADPEGKGDY